MNYEKIMGSIKYWMDQCDKNYNTEWHTNAQGHFLYWITMLQEYYANLETLD